MIGNCASPVSMICSTVRRTWLIGIAKPDADVAALAGQAAADGGDRGVDADDLALEVDQRPAGVAGVDGGVGLDRVDVGAVAAAALVAGGHRPVLRADDAAGDGAGQAQRRADRHDRVADDDRVGVAERQRGEVLRVHPQHRDVVARRGPDDVRGRRGAVDERHVDRRPALRRRRGCW